MQRAIVLLSGGLDSATTLAVAASHGFACQCLTVLYGQRHAVEVEAAKRVASALHAHEHKFVEVDLRQFGGSALTDDIAVPKDELGGGIPVTYVPARNTVMLSLALAFAEVAGAHDIFVGVNAVDYSGYPDCRPEYIRAFENLATLATKAGVEGNQFRIRTPLIDLTKTEIIQLGLSLGVDYSLTHSCYDPDSLGRACGHCDSCLIRAKAFADLGLVDPALP
ncbi:MAG: 7-cyano-7-deazaguanine synthase QueC [Armatimonadetes bacterium]|nr:7-cyano-7-deazaguanine synthase QueC [Armatimonadota bacterium]